MNFWLILVDIGLRWFMSTTVNQNNFCPLFLECTFASRKRAETPFTHPYLHTPSPLRGTPPSLGGELKALAKGENSKQELRSKTRIINS